MTEKGGNKLKRFLFILCAMFLFSVGSAQAATYDLNLKGDVSTAYSSYVDFEGIRYDFWGLSLDGLTPFTAYQGDTVNATISFNDSITIESYGLNTTFQILLSGNNSSGYDTAMHTFTTFYNDETQVGGIHECTSFTRDWLITGPTLYPEYDSSPITFDKVTINFSIDKIVDKTYIPGSLDISNASFRTVKQSPVPIPPSLFLLGSGLVGLAGFRKRFFIK
jgi:hypothetical protein